MFYTKPAKSLEHFHGVAYSPLNSAMLSCSCKARKALELCTYLAVCWMEKTQLRGTNLGHPWVDFWNMIFYNLKDSNQDLSNEGSNFTLNSLEVGQWVAQT